MKKFSILIPTYNRLEKLRKVLQVLSMQEGIEHGEVIVGIDGSEDGTRQYMESLTDFPCEIRCFGIEHSGRSVIRNRLLDRARGTVLIFIQDDILVDKGWLQAHLMAQKSRPGAAVGYVTWYEKTNVTPYMLWLEDGGHMLDFSGLREGEETDFWHFYMGNISLSADCVQDLRFDEDLKGYGWEDILFGYEFSRRGGRITYLACARSFHWDEYLEEDLEAYMQQIAKSAVSVGLKYPDIGILPSFWKRSVFFFIIWCGGLLRPLLPQRWKWYLDMKSWFLSACRRELKALQ